MNPRGLQNPRLCEDCQPWNDRNNYAFSCNRQDMSRTTSLADRLQHPACILCSRVGAAVREKIQDLELRDLDANDIGIFVGTAFRVNGFDRSPTVPGLHGSRSFKCVLYIDVWDGRTAARTPFVQNASQWWRTPTLGLPLQLHYELGQDMLERADVWEQPFFDTQRVRSWITGCELDHGLSSHTTLPTHFRLVDVNRLCVVDMSEDTKFVALSYMWRAHNGCQNLQLTQMNLDELSRPGALTSELLPEVIFDAIILCKDLGESYIWVDRLCIVQDDLGLKSQQIKHMDTIYNMAAFTICAAVDASKAKGLPGVRGRPRRSFFDDDTRLYHAGTANLDFNFFHTVDRSAWNTRGWTYQERILSPHCLYITDHQIYWGCLENHTQEDVGTISPREYRARRPPVASGIPPPGLGPLARYLECVSHYTSRKLSYESDIEAAFAGVGNVLAAELGTTLRFCLPETYLTESMLWYSGSHPVRRRRDVPEIPSWSWAAWAGPTKYNSTITFNIGTLVTFHIIDADSADRRLNSRETWFGQTIDFDACSTLEAMKGRKYMPNDRLTTETWRSCPQNPWNAKDHLELSALALQTALAHPGCLVFNTMAATVSLKPVASMNHDEMVPLEICDMSGAKIGDIEMDRTWMESKLDPGEKHTVLVLCAAISPKSARQAIHRALREGRRSPWLLVVMLVERHRGVSFRLGLGFVETPLWAQAQPKWETVVLG